MSEYSKIRTRKNFVFGQFARSELVTQEREKFRRPYKNHIDISLKRSCLHACIDQLSLKDISAEIP